jgi:hypothetical protein
MNPYVKNVRALDDYQLALEFENDEQRIFDMKPYLNHSFSRTRIAVATFQHGDETLMSRSEAKQLLKDVEQATEIILDFKGIATVGQSFADEIFRVFAREHPHIHLTPVHANADIMKMISRAKNAGN